MDLLQSFMGCMYPGSIRTESIESMDYPDYRFQVKNIDERGAQVSDGELHLTDRDLIYFRPGKIPTRWPLNNLRRYGSDRDTIFLFEAGRSSPMEGIFAFRLNKTTELNRLENRMKEMMQKLAQNNNSNDPRPTDQNADNILRGNQYVPDSTSQHNNLESRQQQHRRRDVSTSTEHDITFNVTTNQFNQPNNNNNPNQLSSQQADGADPRPLSSYVLIDHDITRALNESAQAHAASRQTTH